MKYLLLFLFSFVCINMSGQDSIPGLDQKLLIGITETPPFVLKKDGEYVGLSVASWELVNEKLDAEYEFRVFPSLDELLTAVETGKVDFSINPITVTDQRMLRMDFSQPYFISHTAIAKRTESMIWSFIRNIMSWKFISAILILLGVILIFGFLVWIFEREKNKEQFDDGIKGILQGFWWSAVTMTTVGYGDKSPVTLGGRIIGFIWMFLAIILISSLTAGIASSLTVRNMHSNIENVQDLGNFRVTTVRSSSAEELLEQYGISVNLVSNAEEGLQHLMNKEVDLFVYDQPILKYLIEQDELSDELAVLPKTLKKDYYSYSFPEASPLIKIIDPVLIATLKTMLWTNLVKDYK